MTEQIFWPCKDLTGQNLFLTGHCSLTGCYLQPCHSLQYHFYADDSQLYISFQTDCFADLAQAKSSVKLCVKDIDWWMTNNMLNVNQEKTEPIVISAKFRPRPAIKYVSVGDEQILPKSSVRNLGVTFDECCNMVEHEKRFAKRRTTT